MNSGISAFLTRHSRCPCKQPPRYRTTGNSRHSTHMPSYQSQVLGFRFRKLASASHRPTPSTSNCWSESNVAEIISPWSWTPPPSTRLTPSLDWFTFSRPRPSIKIPGGCECNAWPSQICGNSTSLWNVPPVASPLVNPLKGSRAPRVFEFVPAVVYHKLIGQHTEVGSSRSHQMNAPQPSYYRRLRPCSWRDLTY